MGLPLPPVARYPSRPQQQQPMDYNAWAGPGGDYGVGGGGGMPLDYPIGGFDDEVPMTPPPKKVLSEWTNQSRDSSEELANAGLFLRDRNTLDIA